MDRYQQPLIWILLLQESAPWDERNTFLPVLTCLALLLSRLGWVRLSGAKLPPFDRRPLLWGSAFMFGAVVCFVKGLSDTDFAGLRVWHGFWHIFVGLACYFFFKARFHSSSHAAAGDGSYYRVDHVI